MDDCKILNAKVYSDGTLRVEFEQGNKRFTLNNVKLTVTSTEEIPCLDFTNFLKPKHRADLRIKGEFDSVSSVNKIEDISPLEVTIEEIEKKFGRKIKIVGDERW